MVLSSARRVDENRLLVVPRWTKQFSVRSSFFCPLLSLSLSLSPNHVIVLAVMISSRREIIFAPIHLKQPCPEGEWSVRMVLSIRLFNNSQLLYIYSFASGRVQPSTVIYFRSFVSFSRLSSTPHLLRLRHFFSTPPDNTHARPAERVEFTFSSSFFFFFFFFNVLLQRW